MEIMRVYQSTAQARVSLKRIFINKLLFLSSQTLWTRNGIY